MAFPSLSFCFHGVIVLLAIFGGGFCKIYDKCELARELKTVHKIPEAEVATWVCVARHESEFNTSAVNQASGDHGLFQISQLFWCSPPGGGHACGLSCAQLKDDDIKDDVICARRIYREHKRLSGDGFNAWVVYRQHCSDGRSAQYTEGCTAHANTREPDANNEVKQGFHNPIVVIPSTEPPVSTSTTQYSQTHVNNIAKHVVSIKSAAGLDGSVAKGLSAKPDIARGSLSGIPTPARVSSSGIPTPSLQRATNYFNAKQAPTYSKPASNMPHKGFRIINGIVTYY